MKSIDVLAEEIHEINVSKGFWDDDVDIHFILAKIALGHSECSEVLEAVRKEKGEDEILDEIADICIRTFDLWWGLMENGYVSGGLQEAIERKMAFNKERPHRHGVLA